MQAQAVRRRRSPPSKPKETKCDCAERHSDRPAAAASGRAPWDSSSAKKDSNRPAAAASGRALLEIGTASKSGLNRKAVVHTEQMKLVGARPRSGIAEQGKCSVTHHRRQLLVGQDQC